MTKDFPDVTLKALGLTSSSFIQANTGGYFSKYLTIILLRCFIISCVFIMYFFSIIVLRNVVFAYKRII